MFWAFSCILTMISAYCHFFSGQKQIPCFFGNLSVSCLCWVRNVRHRLQLLRNTHHRTPDGSQVMYRNYASNFRWNMYCQYFAVNKNVWHVSICLQWAVACGIFNAVSWIFATTCVACHHTWRENSQLFKLTLKFTIFANFGRFWDFGRKSTPLYLANRWTNRHTRCIIQ